MKDVNCPLISIVMLNYNGLKYLKKTIPLILELDYPNYEFIIVDNGSIDGSIELIKEFEKIRLIENRENLGYSKGKNIGAREAKGEYILSLDNDILLINKDILIDLIQFYDNNMGFVQILLKDIGYENTKYYGIYFSIYGANFHQKPIIITKMMDYKKQILIGAPTGGCFFISKNKWNFIGGFDESQPFNLDDLDVGARAWIYGFKNYLYTKSYAVHMGINKTSTAESYSNRFRFVFSGHARSMLKNYKISNLIINFPLLFTFQFIKSIRYSVKKRSIKVFFAFLWSITLFLKNFSDTLKQRKVIQSKRSTKYDIFLKIKSLGFD
ncbi:MAG: glycosyltransferase family 2 protein [Candidatus Cloacimonetes bacterium]|nr:glycosyltransferase family 2 protein [Candidatus Cloacimonadota bacterium]